MKSKIVKQFGAMLLAGTMIVTSGNVTTYAAEHTDESQEVDVNTESETEQDDLYEESKPDEDIDLVIDDDSQNELYNAYRKDRTKLAEGDGYLICKEKVNGKERTVAHLFVDKSETDKNPDEVLESILNCECIDENSIVALTTRYIHITVPKSVVDVLKKKNMALGVVTSYYDSYEYDELYFDKIEKSDEDYSFKVEYDTDKEVLDNLSGMGIDGYMFTISNDADDRKPYDTFYGDGILNQAKDIERDISEKNINDDNLRLYYYDSDRNKYIHINSKINYHAAKVSSSVKINGVWETKMIASIKAGLTSIKYYGTYLVCNNTLPDSMVFNLTGLEKDGDSLLYYTNGLRDTSYTGLCGYDGTTYYVKDGTVDYNANMLYEYNGSTWNIKNGKVDTTESMTMNNGYFVYTNGGKTNNETTLCKYNGEWYYIHNGKVDYSVTTLYKYNGSWWYIENGKVNFNKNGLCKYNGSWWYISGGKVNFNATGLCKYNGSWWYVSGGKVNFNATGLCKYNGTWWYVSSGRVNFNATGLCKYNGYWFYVENGAVRFKNTLCKYKGTWWYINNGVVNFSKTTLCKYGKNWFAVSKGKVAWNYTGYINYNGGRYKVINGVVKF